MHSSLQPLNRLKYFFCNLWPYDLWPNINWWVRTRDGLSLWQVWCLLCIYKWCGCSFFIFFCENIRFFFKFQTDGHRPRITALCIQNVKFQSFVDHVQKNCVINQARTHHTISSIWRAVMTKYTGLDLLLHNMRVQFFHTQCRNKQFIFR